jgi:hypothetical protein
MQKIERYFEKIAYHMRPAGIYKVPNYVVGSNQLMFFYNGQLCIQGDGYQYTEIGKTGEISCEIDVNFNFDRHSEITILILPLPNNKDTFMTKSEN